MIELTQSIVNTDIKNKIYGDCYRTAVACILERPLEEVPHNWVDQKPKMNEWIKGQGYRIINMCYDGKYKLPDILIWCSQAFHGMHYILAGTSPRYNDLDHVVICLNDQMIWDTHPNRAYISEPSTTGFWHMEIIVKEL